MTREELKVLCNGIFLEVRNLKTPGWDNFQPEFSKGYKEGYADGVFDVFNAINKAIGGENGVQKEGQEEVETERKEVMGNV